MSDLSQILLNLKTVSETARTLYHVTKTAQIELKKAGIEVPETLKRTLYRLDMDLDELAFDLDQMIR